MKNKNIIKQLKYSIKLIDIFNIYVECVEEYFNNEENKKNNKELYNYFINLKENLINSAKEHGVIE